MIASQGFRELPVSMRHGQAAGALAGSHRDLFDRMLVAQAMLENFVLVQMNRFSTLLEFGDCGESTDYLSELSRYVDRSGQQCPTNAPA